jgi:hypothetical protein
MLRMCVYMHSRFVENHLIRILEDGPLISEGVLSQPPTASLEWSRTPSMMTLECLVPPPPTRRGRGCWKQYVQLKVH